jgi:hypothetical protein
MSAADDRLSSYLRSPLLTAFKEKVVDVMVDDLMADLRPRVEIAVRAAVGELDVHVRNFMDDRGRQLVLELEVRLNGERVPGANQA